MIFLALNLPLCIVVLVVYNFLWVFDFFLVKQSFKIRLSKPIFRFLPKPSHSGRSPAKVRQGRAKGRISFFIFFFFSTSPIPQRTFIQHCQWLNHAGDPYNRALFRQNSTKMKNKSKFAVISSDSKSNLMHGIIIATLKMGSRHS